MFQRSPFSVETEQWPSPFAVPRFLNGRLSLYDHAHHLLHSFYQNRVHVVVRPGPELVLNASLQGVNVPLSDALGLAAANATWRHRFGTLAGGLYTGDPGRLKASAVLRPLPGCVAYSSLDLVLDQVEANRHDLIVGLGVNTRLFTGFIHNVLRAPGDLGTRFEARSVMRVGALQIATQGVFCVDPHGNASPSGDEAESVQVGDVTVHTATVRAVYSATTHGASGQPHSYQIGLALEDFGRTLVGSYYHHTTSRVCAQDHCFWRNLAFGGEFHHRRQGRTPELLLGSMVQLTANTLVKARVSSKGAADVLLAARFWNLHELVPEVLASVSAGWHFRTSAPRLGLTLTLGEQETDQDVNVFD